MTRLAHILLQLYVWMMLNEKYLLGLCLELLVSSIIQIHLLYYICLKIHIGIHHYDNGSLINRLVPHHTEISALLYLPHKHAILSISHDGRARLHDSHSASSVTAPASHAPTDSSSSSPPPSLSASKILSPSASQNVRNTTQTQRDARSVLKTTRFQRDVCCSAYSSILNLVACVSKDIVIRLWDPERYVLLL